MGEIATLGFRVDTTDFKAGEAALKKFGDQAQRTETQIRAIDAALCVMIIP